MFFLSLMQIQSPAQKMVVLLKQKNCSSTQHKADFRSGDLTIQSKLFINLLPPIYADETEFLINSIVSLLLVGPMVIVV